jgi:hypothetical protein
MADFVVGAGSGDRTRITSLEGLRRLAISTVFRVARADQSTNESRFIWQHSARLPQPYRAGIPA